MEVKDIIDTRQPEQSVPTDLASLEAWFDSRFEHKMQEREASHVPSMTIIATKGTMDMAYPPFILASTAAALGWEVAVFFTFYGLTKTSDNKASFRASHAPRIKARLAGNGQVLAKSRNAEPGRVGRSLRAGVRAASAALRRLDRG